MSSNFFPNLHPAGKRLERNSDSSHQSVDTAYDAFTNGRNAREKFIRTILVFISLFVCGTMTYAQSTDRTIYGIVVDENGEPLPAARVEQVRQTKDEALTAVVTDINGHFRLTLLGTAKEIEVSYLGYETKKVNLTDAESYKIDLQPNIELLSEVVVTGYQTISRERATGSFAKVDAKKLETQRLSNISSLMEGRIAGYRDGRIRGVTTMNGVSTPLYVIDGFPVEKTTTKGYGWEESIPDVNMEDIESITVLKDAAAASIYGARAANGVVVITTKRAKMNRLDISFSATLTTQPYNYYTGHLADAATMIGLEKEWAEMNPELQGSKAKDYAQNLLDNAVYSAQGIRAILNNAAGKISPEEMNRTLDELASQGYRYYNDVEKYGKRNPFSQQYNLSIGKSNERNTFNASFSYRHNSLEDRYSNNESFGLNMQNTTGITSWLSMDLGTYLNYGDGATQSYSVTSPGYTYMPYNTLLNADGSPYTNTEADRYSKSQQGTLRDNGLYHLDITPLEEMKMNLQKNKDFSNRTFARLNFKLTDWLKYAASFQYEVGEYKSDQLKDKSSYEVRNKVNTFATSNKNAPATFNLPYGNIYATATNSSRAYNFRQQFDFQKTFAGAHDVTAILGTETRENKLEYNRRHLYDYDPDLLTYSLINEQLLSKTSGLWGWASFSKNDVFVTQELVNRYVSFYGNAAYTYAGKYMVTGSIRWDRTNLFATGSKYQNKPIWSAGAGWNIDKEDFFEVDFVDMLKLRTSYGIGGNIAKDSAPYMTAYYSSNIHVGGISGSISSRPNPELRWEKTTTANIGIDFALLKNRLTGTIEYYNKKGEDLLANTNGVPTEGWGYSTYTMNNGKMRNRGVELSLSGEVFSTKDWSWNVTGVLGYNKNKVTYVNVKAPALYLVFDHAGAYPRVGNPFNAIYGYQWAGLNEKGLPQVYDSEGTLFSESEPTKIEDAVYLGTTIPIYNGAINTNLRYKQWELAAQFLFEGGHKMRNTNIAFLSGMVPVSKNIEKRWRQPGDEAHTDIPRYVPSENPDYNSSSKEIYSKSSANILNASHGRLRNLSLTYRVPDDFSQKFHLKNVRIMFGMENVFLIAKNRDSKWSLGGYSKPNYLCSINVNF
mgnify:FL=1